MPETFRDDMFDEQIEMTRSTFVDPVFGWRRDLWPHPNVVDLEFGLNRDPRPHPHPTVVDLVSGWRRNPWPHPHPNVASHREGDRHADP